MGQLQSRAGSERRPSPKRIAIILFPIGVVTGAASAAAGFLINSHAGVNTDFPISQLGLLAVVFLGLAGGLIVTAVGFLSLMIAARVTNGRTVAMAIALGAGCLIGGLLGSLFIRPGVDSWGDALLQSEIVGVPVAVVLASVITPLQSVTHRRQAVHD